MNWRPVGRSGEPYPAWLRKLRDKSGAYAIRQGGRVVYVGESHKGRLYGTITRHFQGWRRQQTLKQFFVGLFVDKGADPGFTYERGACEVAVRVTSSRDAAIDLQDQWIRRLDPRDNTVGKLEDAPF